jgi:hypothetical protein
MAPHGISQKRWRATFDVNCRAGMMLGLRFA